MIRSIQKTKKIRLNVSRRQSTKIKHHKAKKIQISERSSTIDKYFLHEIKHSASKELELFYKPADVRSA